MTILDPTDLEGQRQLRAEQTRLRRAAVEEEKSDLRKLMSGEVGRRFMVRLIERAGVFRLSYVGGDSQATAFAEGCRNEGLRLLSLLDEACPEMWQTARKEAREARKNAPVNNDDDAD